MKKNFYVLFFCAFILGVIFGWMSVGMLAVKEVAENMVTKDRLESVVTQLKSEFRQGGGR